jgi:hypothetical protein
MLWLAPFLLYLTPKMLWLAPFLLYLNSVSLDTQGFASSENKIKQDKTR